MCSINHDLKAIYIHIHKTGGTTMAMNLKSIIILKHIIYEDQTIHSFVLIKKEKIH